MDEITDQNQPVSHPLSLTCGSPTRWGPGRPGVPGIVHRRGRGCSPCISRGFPMPWPWPC